MKLHLAILPLLAPCLALAALPAQLDLKRDMVLWYRQPATRWNEAMPLGNGLMGAMVFGGAGQERIALNESTFWSGRPHDYNDPEAIKYFPRIRDLVFAGKFQEAEQMANAHFWGVPASQQCFEPLGDLVLSQDGAEEPVDYRRELDMETGVARITYRAGDAVFTREVFVSYPDRVMVIRIASDKPGKVSVEAGFKSPFPFTVTAKPDKLIMDGHWQGPVAGDWIGTVGGDGLRFQVALVARPEGGKSTAAENRVQITGANAVTLVVTAATSFVNYHDISGDSAARCEKVLAAVVDKDYDALRRRHVADFAALMDRVRLHVGDTSANEKPTDARLRAVRGGDWAGPGRGRSLGAPGQPSGPADPNLEALCFQFGRYALISSSRAGGQPANLQAIWNENVSPPWGSKYTININTQMNYWPAEVCNLPECHQPLFDMLKDASVTGAETAKMYYGAGGWVAHHNLDLWRGTAPVDRAQFGMWPVGGAWLCRHIWEHYEFTRDKDFLKEYYPIMRGSAQFLLDVMVEEPKHHWLVTPFSMSPEHGYYDSQGRMSFLSPSPTLDVAIIRDLFSHCIEASKLLGIDDDFRQKLEAALTRIPPYRVNSAGNIQEWIEDWQSGPQGHTVSPQFPFFPGDSIQLRRDPQLAAAEEHWMNSRGFGGGWPAAWGISMWARLERGDRVGAALHAWIARSPGPNMYNAGANQCDATFGFTAGVAEALVQSHAGEISLLPALPSGWPDGSVTGLRARGGFEVSIAWSKGKLQSAEIRHTTGADCKVRYGTKTATFSIKPGATLRLDAGLDPQPVQSAPAAFDGAKGTWHGFDRFDYLLDERTLAIKPADANMPGDVRGQRRCIVVAPRTAASGIPWSWRGCYWDHQPQTEIELLNRGFHIAYIAADTAKRPDEKWDAWYAFLTEKHGLSKKPAFIGMSRGGEFAFTWAVRHPDRVACIYADNPGGNPEIFARLQDLAAADVPVLEVCGSIDPILGKFALPIEAIYEQFGGRISIMIKDGAGHHPHSLHDPKPIADFIEQSVREARGASPAFAGRKFTRTSFYSNENSYRQFPGERCRVTCRGPAFAECYDRYSFDLEGIEGSINVIAPKTAAPGKPWVYRAGFAGRDALVDLALLAKGFHIVTGPVGYNADGPQRRPWDAVYRHLTAYGFAKKPVMEGAGAAAGEVYAWAIANPEKVACIFAENPVLRDTTGNVRPLDNLAPLAKAGVPLLHVCGSADPWLDSQTRVAQRRYADLGGKIEVIVKEGDRYRPITSGELKQVVDFIIAN